MPQASDPRAVALNVVLDALRPGRDLQMVLDRNLDPEMDLRDRSLATELAYGYLRYKGRLDFVLNCFLKSPAGLSGKIRVLMGLAAYEIFFLERIPDYAAVSRAVALTRKRFGSRMSSLVNAVLRKCCRVDAFDPDFFRQDHPGEMLFLSRFYSCPEWVVKLWQKDYGTDMAREYLKQSLQKPAAGVRLAPGEDAGRLDEHYVLQRIGPSILLRDNYPGLEDLEKNKKVVRQSFAGQKTLWELGMGDWKSPVWDMCAGRGGKTMLMSSQGLQVWASDNYLPRLAGLKKELLEQVQVQVFAAQGQSPPLKKSSGTVLVDAPCTGLGVLSRRPDTKWKRSPRDVLDFCRVQKELLAAAANVLPSKGQLIYVTCTLSRQENQEQVTDFLKKHKDFECLQTYGTGADEDLGEFFFGARLQRR
ncbi:Fmu (Sun) domain protein [Desulfonatronospira thiodismutans ASO3-1]|uniref:Fmu (Sun) domain protein n=2 Tax=Desulfonatronospira TaxID=488937 RepID=D6SQG4_9BACT|nr:transcription antitermination factor NusB [Desulfonatronospira thiodismutans]EFI34990.1 Fmu (Sun) domain protein [Desulfonatronospira thiodismutans ASO3-1]